MGPEAGFLIIPVFIAIAIGFRLFAGGMDKDRVRDYVISKGGRVISIEWHPFGTGWFGERDSRIYAVHYKDRDGHMHRATCKTSLFSGVYFTEDTIVSHTAAKPSLTTPSLADVQAENLRLRRELAQLKADKE